MKNVRNEKNWDEVIDIEYLNSIPLTSLGNRHKPVSHGLLLGKFKSKMLECNFLPNNQVGLLSPDKLKYIYLVELPTFNGFYDFKFGFLNYNNRQYSFTGLAGERVFACSNGCYSGLLKSSRRKHTKNILEDIDYKIEDIFSAFFDFKTKRKYEIDMMRHITLTPRNIASFVLELHRNSSLSGSTIGQIIDTFDSGDYDRTAWGFFNAGTEALKKYDDKLEYKIKQTKSFSDTIGGMLNG